MINTNLQKYFSVLCFENIYFDRDSYGTIVLLMNDRNIVHKEMIYCDSYFISRGQIWLDLNTGCPNPILVVRNHFASGNFSLILLNPAPPVTRPGNVGIKNGCSGNLGNSPSQGVERHFFLIVNIILISKQIFVF